MHNVLKHIPWTEVLATLDELAEAGLDRDRAIELVAEMLDKALPLDTLIAGPAGAALEQLDGPVLRATLELLWRFAENKESRQRRREARRARREARRAS